VAKRGGRGERELAREPQGKEKVFDVALVDRAGVGEEKAA
jgi:hypothetical protein